MKEQLIDLETAELAWSKGFKKRNNTSQTLLQKWLREVHKIQVESNPAYDNNTHSSYCRIISTSWFYVVNKLDSRNLKEAEKFYRTGEKYPSYESALEIGLQEALKLI